MQLPEAQQVIEQVAAERDSPLAVVGRDYLYAQESHSLSGQAFKVWRAGTGDSNPLPVQLTIPLLGRHQVENAAAAYAALQAAAGQGLTVSEDAIRQGFARVVWPARFELLCREPLLIVDSAHNRDSAERLRQTLDDYLPGREIVLIFGASDDKDLAGMFAALQPRIREVIATQSIHPRAAGAEKLAALVREQNRPAQAVAPVENAVEVALERAGQNGVILAAGSLFIAAAVRAVWEQRSHQAEQTALPTGHNC
jgi:dihydrofolate synthase/folylpolyglutamate synthase